MFLTFDGSITTCLVYVFSSWCLMSDTLEFRIGKALSLVLEETKEVFPATLTIPNENGACGTKTCATRVLIYWQTLHYVWLEECSWSLNSLHKHFCFLALFKMFSFFFFLESSCFIFIYPGENLFLFTQIKILFAPYVWRFVF